LTPTTPELGALTLAEFIELLERRAPEGAYAEAIDLLRIVAGKVPPEQRLDVLEALPDVGAATEPDLPLRAYPDLPEDEPGSELVEEADAFVRRLENGNYYEGMRWDEERHEERAWGDESWCQEMDELFGKSATAYLAGGYTLSARVYGRLLATFRHADRPGIFCGPEAPARMVQTELSQAKRRYLVALFVVSPTEDRPQRLLNEMEALRNIGQTEIGLRSMLEAESEADTPLEGLEAFLPDWISALKGVRQDPRGWGREARRLLREAVELHAGVDGLGQLARQTGADHPEAYHDWVGLLVRMERPGEAIRAAREGVNRIRDDAYRARLADRLALLASGESELELAVEATRNAWRASPTQVRLLHMIAAAEAADMRDAVLAREASAVLRPDWNHSDALACRLLLLVGRHEEAATRFQRASALGWGRADHAGSVVLPFLLLGSTELPEPPRGSAIESFWKDLDNTGRNYFDRRVLLDRMAEGETSTRLFENERPYSDLLREALSLHPIPEVSRPRMLAVAQLKVEAVVREILHGQHRRGQTMAARMAAAVGEAIALQRREDGLVFVRGLRKEYRRYGGFVERLAEERASSPILPDSGGRVRVDLELVRDE
jgi:tetratricopeptide (TPR) repeat protein